MYALVDRTDMCKVRAYKPGGREEGKQIDDVFAVNWGRKLDELRIGVLGFVR